MLSENANEIVIVAFNFVDQSVAYLSASITILKRGVPCLLISEFEHAAFILWQVQIGVSGNKSYNMISGAAILLCASYVVKYKIVTGFSLLY